MIQPLRRAHRMTFVLLAGALPVIFAAGLIARRPPLRVEHPSDRITLLMPSGTEMIIDSREVWGSAVDAPDPLVYWTEHDPGKDSLPANVRLLGSLDFARRATLRVPGRGFLILYSLGWQKAVAKSPVPKEMP